MRKQINYSDDPAMEEQVFNFNEFDEDNNNIENDYTPIEVPRKRENREREREGKAKEEEVDIDQLIKKPKGRFEEDLFEEDN
jgi:hypothetical protein